MSFQKILLFVVGSFSIMAAGMNWNWFFNHSQAAFMTKLLRGRNNARLFYFGLGLLLIYVGLYF